MQFLALWINLMLLAHWKGKPKKKNPKKQYPTKRNVVKLITNSHISYFFIVSSLEMEFEILLISSKLHLITVVFLMLNAVF